MTEYIKRDDALRGVELFQCGWAEIEAVQTDYIGRLPAADVSPVVHGRWSDAGFGELPKHAPYGWACSACGGIAFNNEYNYCPNCGAKMDGGDEGEH